MKKKNSTRINFRNNNGYMLIESLIAIAIFSIGFLAVATMVLSATRNNTNGNILTQANMLAREKTEELKNTTDLTELDTPAAPEVKVGSVAHPMEESHYIEWVEIIADGEAYRQFLNPGETPEATFCIEAEQITAREYCNLHGLWKA